MSEDSRRPSKTILMTLGQFDIGLLCLEALRAKYPNCFYAFGREKPLKKSIFLDLCDLSSGSDLARNTISAALRIYTSSMAYRASLIREESQRIDLDGNAVEAVTAEERTHAKFRPLDLKWKINALERSLVQKLKKADKAHKQKLWEACQKKC